MVEVRRLIRHVCRIANNESSSNSTEASTIRVVEVVGSFGCRGGSLRIARIKRAHGQFDVKE